jgi:hypothetical protein
MRFHSPKRFYLIATLSLATRAQSYALDDGVYLLKRATSGSEIQFPGGYPAQLDRKLDRKEYDLEVVSVSNSNDQFEIDLTDKLGKAPGGKFVAIVADEKVIVEIGGNHDFAPCNRELAVKIAAFNGSAPHTRRNVRGALSLRFVPSKGVYKGREPIDFVVHLKNEGAESLFVQSEPRSKTRSASMDIIVDEGSPVSCTDVRSKFVRMSIGGPRRELKPGDTMELRQEDVRRWFIPKQSGLAAFKVIYTFNVYDNPDGKWPVWVENFADTLIIKYEE